MKRPIRRLPDSELELMQIIWQKEPPVSRSDIEAVIKGPTEPGGPPLYSIAY